MNLNAGFFAAYSHRRKPPKIEYRLPLNNQQASVFKSARSSPTAGETFLPSISSTNSQSDGHRPYRRNDFANNHLFIAKQKLARVFLDQPAMNIQSKSELIHLFDHYEPKQKTRRGSKLKRQENHSDTKSIPSMDRDVHLSVVNLVMKPSLPSGQRRDSPAAISHRRIPAIPFQIRAPRPSIEWINPAITQHFRITANYSTEDDLVPMTLVNAFKDDNPQKVTTTDNPRHSSVSYVRSIIPSTTTET